MISPILTYNSEVWGAFVKSDSKSWDNFRIEKTYLHFCKRYLQVHNKSSNVACRSELGRFPLIIDINNKILNYLNYLQEKDEKKQSLKISVDLYHSGQNSFYSSLKKMTDYYDFPGFNCNLLNECKIKQYVDLTQKKYITYWNHTLQHSQKLNFYYKIKTNYSPSVYLDLTRKNPSRKTLLDVKVIRPKILPCPLPVAAIAPRMHDMCVKIEILKDTPNSALHEGGCLSRMPGMIMTSPFHPVA